MYCNVLQESKFTLLIMMTKQVLLYDNTVSQISVQMRAFN